MADKQEIVFGQERVPSAAQEAYRKKIEAARTGVSSVKGSEPVGSVPRPNIPDFQKMKAGAASPSGLNEEGGVSPRPAGSPVLRPETEQQLQEAIKAGQEELKTEASQVAQGKKDDLFEAFDFGDQKTNAERILDNKKRREEIESRCAPMKFEDLLYKNEVSQKVPILPGKFEPTFRSLTPEESLFVKRYIAKEQDISDQYILEKYNMCLLTCSLVDLNDRPLPDHRDGNGSVDDKLFETKLKVLLKKSGYIIADLAINYSWFDVRVRKLITADGLKNG